MWNTQSQNLYAYVSNNPLRYIDPSGHWAIEITANLTINEMKWEYAKAKESGGDYKYWENKANKLREKLRAAGYAEQDIMQSTDAMIPEEIILELAWESTNKWIETDKTGIYLYTASAKILLEFSGKGKIKLGKKTAFSNKPKVQWRPLKLEDAKAAGFEPGKKFNGKMTKVPKGKYEGRYGWEDKNGDIWVPAKPGESHGGLQFDVQLKSSSYKKHRNVFVD